ncbi:MAG: hypothetical protein ACKOSR_04685, partial [Flavobacteriales bacterium]
GKPVIRSDRTPWDNLQSKQAGWDLPRKASAFVNVLRSCLNMGQEEYSSMSNAASIFGRNHSNDPTHLEAYYSLFA